MNSGHGEMLLGPAQTWEMALDTSANGTTVTATCRDVPISWVPSLSELWTYWFDRRQADFDAIPCELEPWNVLGP